MVPLPVPFEKGGRERGLEEKNLYKKHYLWPEKHEVMPRLFTVDDVVYPVLLFPTEI